jgi:flagellar motility protein MotE (MotC chaperone)
MTIRRENGKVSALLLGAAGLATILAAVPQPAGAQGWQAEIAPQVRNAAKGSAVKSAEPKPQKRKASVKAWAASVVQPAPPKPLLGVEPAKAVVITPILSTEDEAPVIISSARKPTPVSAVAKPDQPQSEPAKPEAVIPAAGMSVDPGRTDPDPVKPDSANQTVAQKSAPQVEPAPAPKAVAEPPAAPVNAEIPVPLLSEIDEPPVVIPPAETSTAAVAPDPKAKGRAEPSKAAAAASAKSKPSKAASKQTAAKPVPGATPGSGKAARGKPQPDAIATTEASSRPAPSPITIIGPASLEPVNPAVDRQLTPAAAAAATPVAEPPVAPQPKAEATPPGPAVIATPAAEDEPEPDDPFVDMQLTQRRGQDNTLTTQVVPNNTPPDSTGQATPVDRSPAAQYCSNIADAAVDARIAWQRQNLAEAEKQLTERTQELEAKTAEYQRWLARRDAFSEKAKKVVVDIYTKMKPDAAALQLQALEEETAAAVLVKLDARSASAVMNEMEPEKAARLTSIISGASKGPLGKGRQAPRATGNRS